VTHLRGPLATPGQSILFGIPVLLIGLAVCAAGGVSGAQSAGDLARMQHATGSIVREDKIGTIYKPVVEFTTAAGLQVTFTDSTGSGSPAYKPGDTVDVVYAPGQPQGARIYSLPVIALQLGLPFLCGGFFLISGGMMIYGGIARRRQSSPA
jgi:hypothetical protein